MHINSRSSARGRCLSVYKYSCTVSGVLCVPPTGLAPGFRSRDSGPVKRTGRKATLYELYDRRQAADKNSSSKFAIIPRWAALGAVPTPAAWRRSTFRHLLGVRGACLDHRLTDDRLPRRLTRRVRQRRHHGAIARDVVRGGQHTGS